jgi:hypothetical protein
MGFLPLHRHPRIIKLHRSLCTPGEREISGGFALLKSGRKFSVLCVRSPSAGVTLFAAVAGLNEKRRI